MNKLLFLALLLLVPALSSASYTNNASDFNNAGLKAVKCKKALESYLKTVFNKVDQDFGLARFQIKIASANSASTGLIVLAKALPNAYFVNWPIGAPWEAKYVTKAVNHALSRQPFLEVARVPCPLSEADKNILAFMVFASWQEQKIATKFFGEFVDKLSEYLSPQLADLADAFATERKLYLIYTVEASEKFTDENFNKLAIDVYVYVSVWDGSGATYDQAIENLYDGLKNNPEILNIVINIENETLAGEIDAKAKNIVEQLMIYFKNKLKD